MTVDAMGMLLGTLALVLTLTLFVTRESMLGFPAAIFWAVLGGFSYIQSAATWDIHYFLFFGSMGMTIFSMYAMWGLREKRDTLGDEGMERGESEHYIDEKHESYATKTEPELDEFDVAAAPSNRINTLHDRAAKRRSKSGRKGEFDF